MHNEFEQAEYNRFLRPPINVGRSRKLPMGYEISIDDRHGIAEIRFARQMSHSEHLMARDELLEICRVRKFRKILVDARGLTGTPPSTAELFDFGAAWAKLGRRTAILLVGVLPQDAATQRWWELGETVATNHGFMTRAFDDIDQARAWLQDA